MAIGILRAGVAVLLVRESQCLLISEGIPLETADATVRTVEAIEREISERYPRISRIYIEAQRSGTKTSRGVVSTAPDG